MSPAVRPRWPIGVVLVVVALAAAPALRNGFVWDDVALIVKSDFIHTPANAGKVFGVDTMYAAHGDTFQKVATLDTYRPFSLLTFFVDAAISGRDPIAYHVSNLIAHLCCVWLVFCVARRLLGDGRLAPWAAALFGLHPLLAEAHIWIDGRSDVWCTLFVLLGLLAYLRTGLVAGCAAFACFLAAALFKETAIAVLPALLLLEVRGARRLPLVLAPAVYLPLRAAALHGAHVAGGLDHVAEALRRVAYLWVDGLSSLLVPVRTMPRYLNEEYQALPDAVFWIASAAAVAVAVVAVRMRRRWPLGVFALAWYALALAPAALISCMTWYGFARFLYLPFTLVAVALVDATRALRPGARRLVAAGALVYLALFAVRLALSTRSWHDNRAFYEAILAESSGAAQVNELLGKLDVDEDRIEEAIPLLERAVELDPDNDHYLNNLASAYLRAGDRNQALAMGERGRARFPRQAKFEHIIALATSDPDLGHRLEHILHGLELEPDHAALRDLLARLRMRPEYARALDELVARRPELAKLVP
jgi:tetratricopeptide (TPR) repeat protein